GGGDDDNVEPPETIDPAGTDNLFVVNRLLLPTTATQANSYGLVLDGNPQNRPNNALGQILSTLASQSSDVSLQDSIDKQINTGGIILLNRIKATALTMATGVGSWIYLGDPATATPAPCTDELDTVCGHHLDGTGTFTTDAASPNDARVSGHIIGGQFTGGPGTVTIQIALTEGSADAVTLNLIGARMVGNVTADGMGSEGSPAKLGGAITDSDLHEHVLPALQGILSDNIDKYCTGIDNGTDACGCEDGSTGRTLLDLFDETDTNGDPNPDCMVTLEELEANSLISSLLAPDVDLLDGDGNFNPRKDGVKDSLSLGIAFTTTTADFTYPANPDGL
ncbi:MAG TPA: hypothetical protein VL172_10910, partial [Kofleriaceae bacterium]|nr:hypothetical protein [Kofleriaceae bacterium]